MFLKKFLSGLALFFALQARSTAYYFSSTDGDDSRSATAAQNPATPWRTLAKLNAVFKNLQPGDAVLFKRGDVFEGSITASASGTTSSPISFNAYGTGALPVISGFATLTSWSPAGAKLWEAALPSGVSTVNVVMMNGAFQPIGRTPNNGWLTADAVTANTSLSSTGLTNLDYSGGEVVIRKNRWILDRNRIASQSGTTLNYTSGSGYWATAGYGFFIQNHPATLDQEGEWYVRSQKIGLYATGSPRNNNVQASMVPVLVSINGQSHLAFQNLRFTGANETAFAVQNASGISVSDCEVYYTGNTAFVVNNTTGFTLANSTLDYSNNLAVNLVNSFNVTLRNNTVKHSGSTAGMGGSGDGTYSAFLLSGNGITVEGNNIEQTGYVPISFSGSNISVKNNYINGYTLVKDDGGGIYTWNNGSNAPSVSNRKISGNVVLNGHAANESATGTDKKTSHGIYLDDNTTAVDVEDNTVADCEGFGIYVHNARQNNLRRNTAYNNTVQLEMVHDDVAPNTPINNTEVSDNVLVSLLPSQLVAEYKSNGNDVAGFGSFFNNRYCRPFDDAATIGVLKNVNGAYAWLQTDVEGWQAMYGMDGGSKASPKTFLPYVVSSVNGSNKFANGSFASNAGGLYAYSPAGNCNTTWNASALDGGTLAVSFNSTTGWSKSTVVVGVGALMAGRKYRLRFSLRGGNEQKMVEVYLRKSGSPYNDITDRKLVKVKAVRKEIDFLFTPTESTSDGSIGIDVPEQSSTVFFDNVDLRDVSASDANYTDSVKFLYNATAAPLASSLNGNFIDAKGNVYNSSVSLAPYSSVVLLAGSGGSVSTPTVACSATGSILREQWTDVPGNDVSDIPLTTLPTKWDQLLSLEETAGQGNAYASRIRGYLCAPQTGSYTFWIAADDAAELWLSTDSLPANKTRIAYNLSWTDFREWNKFGTQRSATITLEAGKKYYLEVLHKQGGGGDHLSVAWTLPDGTFEAPVSGTRLSPFVPVATTASCSAAGTILREQWNGIDGNDVAQIPVNAAPSSISYLTSFEGPQDFADRYGSRIRGYVCAPQSGYYTFWIAGDDGTELWLSTDDVPANKIKIAYSLQWTGFREWTRFATQKSVSIYLESGRKYYIEALQKEGNGGDHLSVAWTLPDGIFEAPIGGNRLSPFLATAPNTNGNARGMVAMETATQRAATKPFQEATEKAGLTAWPNPFSNSVQIAFRPAEMSIVVIDLQDVNGRTVAKLFSGEMHQSVPQQFMLNGAGLLPGVYFVRVTSNGKPAYYKLVKVL